MAIRNEIALPGGPFISKETDINHAVIITKNGFKISEIPVQMRERSAGQPSNRNFRLVYYFLRLLIVLLAGTRGKKKE